MRVYVSFEEAVSLILERAVRLGTERVFLTEASGRVLACDVIAPFNQPRLPLSAMDGYAVSVASLGELPARLRLVGEVPAGSAWSGRLGRGEAVTVYTGSPVPKGADAVVPFEQAKVEGGFVVVERPFPSGCNVREVGEDFKEGELLLERGTLLGPAEVGIAAEAGYSQLEVYRRPRVAVFATGNEVVEPFSPLPSPQAVYNANAYQLLAYIEEAGGEPHYLGILRDSREEVLGRLKEALAEFDVVVTTGGVSMGNYDFVKEVVPELGLSVVFYKVQVKPGKPVLFAAGGGRFLFGLPGFPVSTAVSFNLFLFPFLRALQGAKELFRRKVVAELSAPYSRKRAERTEFARCLYSFSRERGRYVAVPLKNQSSGALSTLAGNVALMVVPKGVRKLPEGSSVELILFKEL